MKNSYILNPLALAVTTVASGLILFQPTPANAVNLVQNGNFENGLANFSGNGAFVQAGSNGTNTAFFGAVGQLGFISQAISTSAGQNYTLSYDFLSQGGLPNRFQVQVNGTTLFDQVDMPAQPFTNYSFNFIGTGSDTIQFGGQNDPNYQQLDNVIVDSSGAATAVPEPFTIIGTLIGGTAALRMRKKLNASAN